MPKVKYHETDKISEESEKAVVAKKEKVVYVNGKKIEDHGAETPQKKRGWYLTKEEYEVGPEVWTPVLGEHEPVEPVAIPVDRVSVDRSSAGKRSAEKSGVQKATPEREDKVSAEIVPIE